MEEEFDFRKLFMDVFSPRPGERVLIMVDEPGVEHPDNPAWGQRRKMAREWQAALQGLAGKENFHVHPLFYFRSTGQHGAPLPETGVMNDEEIELKTVFSEVNIAIALTEFSASAALVGFTKQFNDLRAASLPGVSRSMEETALAADYREVARRCHKLKQEMQGAEGVEVLFSTGHRIYFDIRYRDVVVDDGKLPFDKEGLRIINLPSGETFIAPYEGENREDPSRTSGEIPVISEAGLLVYKVVENRIEEIIGEGPQAAETREYFEADPARRNIAELGLGCNDRAVVSGNVLEDEKVLGIHWAYGRSDHIGGKVGVSDFADVKNVVHQDIVYPLGGRIGIKSLLVRFPDKELVYLIRDNEYLVF